MASAKEKLPQGNVNSLANLLSGLNVEPQNTLQNDGPDFSAVSSKVRLWLHVKQPETTYDLL